MIYISKPLSIRGQRRPLAHYWRMIPYLGKNSFEHKSLELGSKRRMSGQRTKREGEVVPNSRLVRRFKGENHEEEVWN